MHGKSLQRYSPSVTLRSSPGSRAVAFCFPGAGASVTCFLPLCNSLSIPLNLIGMQARGMDGMEAPDSSVEDAASACLEAILQIAPTGPYRLLGHSFGGWLAFELAARLISSGRQVLPVVMLDTEPPSSRRAKYDRSAAIKKYVRAVEKPLGRPLNLDLDGLRSLHTDRQIEMLVEAMKSERVLPRSAASSMLKHSFHVFETQLRTEYAPQGPFPADVYLLQTDDVDLDDDDWMTPEEACTRWRQWAPTLHDLRVSGNHMTMLEAPHINSTTTLLQQIWNIAKPPRPERVQ